MLKFLNFEYLKVSQSLIKHILNKEIDARKKS